MYKSHIIPVPCFKALTSLIPSHNNTKVDYWRIFMAPGTFWELSQFFHLLRYAFSLDIQADVILAVLQPPADYILSYNHSGCQREDHFFWYSFNWFKHLIRCYDIYQWWKQFYVGHINIHGISCDLYENRWAYQEMKKNFRPNRSLQLNLCLSLPDSPP